MSRVWRFLMLFCFAAVSMQGAIFSFNNGNLIADDSTELADTRSLSEAFGSGYTITDVNVTINVTGSGEGGSGGWTGDLYARLTYTPAGNGSSYHAILLNRVGIIQADEDTWFGYGDSGLNVTLDDAGAYDIHLYKNYTGYTGGNPTGVYQPDGRDLSPLEVWDTSDRNAMLNVFNGLPANGTWALAFSDWNPGGESRLVSWSLDIQAVPEPVPTALFIFASLFGGFQLVRYLRLRCRKSGAA